MEKTHRQDGTHRAEATAHSQEIAERCVAEAQDVLGAGWQHVSVEIRRGLVMSRIIAVVFSQIPSIGADTILAYQRDLVGAADIILGYEQ